MSCCPGEETLRLLGTDALGDATYASIEEHVEICPACQEILDRLAHMVTDPGSVLPGPRPAPRIPDVQIQAEIGRGAMGIVYLATQEGLDRPVAVKVLPAAVGTEALRVARRRWLREARAVSSIRHPNVVALHDCGEADGWFFLILEFIPGGSLKERLTDPVTPRIAATLVETVARAVAHIHSRGLLHLDLKPSNILLDGESSAPWERIIPRVSDFGLALFDDPGAAETTLAGPRGTPSYMAPEQAAGARAGIGPAADIHALGAILYELLTGRPPFQGTSTLETLDQVRGQEPVPPRRLNPRIPRDLEIACVTCLHKDPLRRYRSAEALADDLRRWLDGRPIQARPVSSLEKAWRWCRRRPVVAALAATLVLTLATGFFSTFSLWRYAETQRIRAVAERVRAEADYQVGRAVLADTLNLGQQSIEPTVVLTRDRVIVSLRSARKGILELAERRPGDAEIWSLLALVDLFLGRNLEYQGECVEGESLYFESLTYWDMLLQKIPGDLTAMHRRWQTLECLGRVLEQEGRLGESVRYWEQAVAAGESVLPRMLEPDVSSMSTCRMALAKLVERQGDLERAAAVLQTNYDMLKATSERVRTSAMAGLLRTTWAALSRVRTESVDLADEAWAHQALALLPSSPGRKGRGESEIPEAGYWLQKAMSDAASRQRRAGQIDRARRTARRMHALANLIVSLHPDHSLAHLALCEAFQQTAKDAWEVCGRAAIERNWRRALEEAAHALRLDPGDAQAAQLVADLERRLTGLLASQ